MLKVNNFIEIESGASLGSTFFAIYKRYNKYIKSSYQGGFILNKNKKNSIMLLIILVSISFVILSFFLIPGIIDFVEKKQEEKINKTLFEIHKQAIIVDDLEEGLHNDSNEIGIYISLSEKVGFDVHNVPKKNKYSLLKDYRSGEIIVKYSNEDKYQYPQKQEMTNENQVLNKDNYNNQDLFEFDVRNGKVIVAGFSEFAGEVLTSESNIQIPESYNGSPVREIADNAFHNKNITGTITIPESVSKIGRNSFTNNGVKQNSNNIPKPYYGTWKLDKNKWVEVK